MPLPERQVLATRNRDPSPPAPIPPPPCSPPPLGRAELRRPWGPRNSLPPSEGAGRGVPRGPRSFLRIAATLRIAGRATRGMPRAPDPGAKTNLRGVAAYAARWGGTGRAPSNPPALGLGFDAWGHSRETRELAGAVGEGATPCTDGRPPENTPAWIASHQSSLPNAAKGYPPREPRAAQRMFVCRTSYSAVETLAPALAAPLSLPAEQNPQCR